MKRLLCWFWDHQWQRTRGWRKDGGWTEQCQRCMSVRFRWPSAALKDNKP